jgi:UDP-glucose 4-epimerase
MTTVLVTGASGLIGRHLITRLASEHEVVCLSRRPVVSPGATAVVGRFTATENLRQLDRFEIDVLIHLAAQTGVCGLDVAVEVNVLGTHRLLEYLYARGCRRFVLASSVAATGCLDEAFVPLVVPIPPDHACLARDAYGLSKALMEEVARYFQRVHADADFVVFRIGPVIGDDERLRACAGDPPTRPFTDLACVNVSDVAVALAQAAQAAHVPGFRLLNLVGSRAHSVDRIVDVLRASLGERAGALDLSWYETPGREHAPVYRMTTTDRGLL